MHKVPHARGRHKHDPANWQCDCKRCRREIDHVFDADRAFFDANPNRRLYCRELIEGEFPPEAVGSLPAGYRAIVVSWVCKPGIKQIRMRSVYGWPLLMRCPNESDRAIVAAFGHLGEFERRWRAEANQ